MTIRNQSMKINKSQDFAIQKLDILDLALQVAVSTHEKRCFRI